jgi:hypothetical protein
MKTSELLRGRLEMAYRWYEGMVSPQTGRLRYLYIPRTDAFVRDGSPIREVASVWDAEVLGTFLERRALAESLDRSLQYYAGCLAGCNGALLLDSGRLGEPSSIAHSAFLILAFGSSEKSVGELRLWELAKRMI